MKVLGFIGMIGLLGFSVELQAYYQPVMYAQAKVNKNSHNQLKVTSASQAAHLVKNRFGGKVLKVSKSKGNTGYRVKLVKQNGHVVSVFVDARTGKIKG